MSQQAIKIPRASDRRVVDTFIALGTEFKASSFNGNALAFAALGDYTIGQEPSAEWAQLLELDSEIINNLSIGIAGQSVSYVRGGEESSKSPIYDEIRFNNVPQVPAATKLAIVSLITRRLLSYSPDRAIVGRGMEAQEQSLAIHNATLERLEALGATIAEQTLSIRSDLEQLYQEKTQTRMAELDAEREQQKTEQLSRANDLDQRAAALNKKLEAVDDRSNTHARREIRDKMLDEVKQRVSKFDVSSSTKLKRIPVEIAMLVLIVVIATMLIYTLKEASALSMTVDRAVATLTIAIESKSNAAAQDASVLLKDATTTLSQIAGDKIPMYWLWARSGFLLIALVAAFIYYIKWQDKWAERHATAELQLRQFEIDISRANWVLESCLEWKKSTEDVIPTILLDRISHGVFVSGSEPAPVLHPADELASALLGSASKVKLRVGDSELDFDKPRKIPK